MDWLHEYENELYEVFKHSKLTIDAFPEPLRQQGMSYLHHFNVFTAESHKNYICYLLPFWLRDGCRLTSEDTLRMSAGNVMLMLYFFIQDDVMDSDDSASRSLLPLANLFYVEFLNSYRPLFPSDSTFWSYFNRYIAEWADSVSNESASDYFLHDRTKIAHKASPLKTSSTAAFLLAGQEELVPISEAMIDDILLTLQMLDDYEDWEDDLASGSYNCLLSLTRSTSTSLQSGLNPEAVRSFIFTSGGLGRLAAIAEATHEGLGTYGLKTPHLYDFHWELVQNLQQLADTIEAEKQRLLSGGLSYWLSKNATE